ncbi:MAG: YIP1 family protein, partial [Chloroflexi bacterium]|nr:YIP1 family protein [Chloroflexota bacterium]
LKDKPAPIWGMRAVLIRFVVTSLTSILALYLSGRLPFAPSRLTFLPIEDYYKAEIFFLPLWGLGIWLLMGGIAHTVIRLFGKQSSFDDILNIIGMGMLVPMPVLWLFDWATIALDWYGLTVQAASHSLAQLWETGVQAVGFRKILGLSVFGAVIMAIIINAVYILLAMVFIR